MKIIADSSPLITLAKIAQLDILPELYRPILITPEVYGEVAVTGAGLAGAAEIVGVLEEAFRLKLIPDLGVTYRQLVISGAFVSRGILQQSLKNFNLPPL